LTVTDNPKADNSRQSDIKKDITGIKDYEFKNINIGKQMTQITPKVYSIEGVKGLSLLVCRR
jgi:hypothetical protein